MWECIKCGKTGTPNSHVCTAELEVLIARYRDMASEAQMKADSCHQIADDYQRQLDQARSA